MSLDLDSFLDSLADALAERVTARLNAPKAPERIPLANVAEHGAPSRRWVESRGARWRDHGARPARR